MPLYQHKSGERHRTVAGSREDDRMRASDEWSPVDESKPARPAPSPRPPAPAAGTSNTTGGE